MEEIDINSLEIAKRFKPYLRFDLNNIVYLKSDLKQKCPMKVIDIQTYDDDFDYDVSWVNSKKEVKRTSFKDNVLAGLNQCHESIGEEFWEHYLKVAKSFKKYLRYDVGQIRFLKSDKEKEQPMTVEMCEPFNRDYDYVLVYITSQKSVKRKLLTQKELVS